MLAAALVVQVAVSAAVLGFPTLVPFVRADLHLTVAQAGLFATIPAAGSFVMLTTIGWAVDRFGDRVVLVAGGLATGGLTALASLAAGYPLLLFLLALVGAGSASPTPAGSSAVMHEFDASERGVIMSVRQTGIPLGGALAALVLPPLTLAAGWRGAMAAAGALSIVGAWACLILYSRAGGGGRRAPAASRGAGGFSGVPLRQVILTGCCAMILAAAQFCVLSFLVLYVHTTWAVPIVAASVLLAVLQIVGAAARIAWGWFSDALFGASRKRTLLAVSLLAAAASGTLAVLPPSSNLLLVGAVCLLLGASALGWNGVYVTLLAELARPGFQGRSISAGMTVTQLGIALGPWLFGLAVDLSGSFRLVWGALAGCLVLAGLAFLRVKEDQLPRQRLGEAIERAEGA